MIVRLYHYGQAEVVIDCYDGSRGDEHRAYWKSHFGDDKSGSEDDHPLVFRCDQLPPGAKVTVEVPVCPQCDDYRHETEMRKDGSVSFVDKCDCGFSWRNWEKETWE